MLAVAVRADRCVRLASRRQNAVHDANHNDVDEPDPIDQVSVVDQRRDHRQHRADGGQQQEQRAQRISAIAEAVRKSHSNAFQ